MEEMGGEKVGEREGGWERERVNTSFSLNTETWVWLTRATFRPAVKSCKNELAYMAGSRQMALIT